MALVVVAPALLVDSVHLRLPPERGLGSAVFYKANSMPRFTEVWWPHAEASGHHIPLASRGGIGFGAGAQSSAMPRQAMDLQFLIGCLGISWFVHRTRLYAQPMLG
jgi:hypothetical protein